MGFSRSRRRSLGDWVSCDDCGGCWAREEAEEGEGGSRAMEAAADRQAWNSSSHAGTCRQRGQRHAARGAGDGVSRDEE